ncbi:MAG: hypothetical protein LBF87_01710 [Treponema sp.]|jgi:predicted nuclease with TOPRIM domain|nr:hypothetical protein [Treponema sp.]
MPAATIQEERKAPTFEEVWALIKEVGEQQKETAAQMRETDRQMKEQKEQWKETDRRMEEQRRETDRRMEEQWKKTSKVLGDLGLRFGEIVEHLIAPNLIKKFNDMDFDLRIASPNRKYYNKNHQELAEVDVLLENSNVVIAVEAKSKLLASHVQDHIERMDILRAYADEHDDRRVWLGAVGGAVLAPDVRKAALKAGFYLIEQSGDTMMISVPEGFKPKEWTFGMTQQTHTSERAE